ncbi:hypothetical protein SAMN04487846_1776 [Microbacterium sp. cf046]|uniref:hypothetical protein n=1 Tax=Microbacterium sp. cf046 TaxID=1761803 RepID=UPI0008E19EB6|nr:hypothetical protein [Microbacterium sp. cf046]SFS04239.1 hypothetical protein SAMN04487846_1776 [Microbacterium sp. cf046]
MSDPQQVPSDARPDAECSRAGCRNLAVWAVVWRNPKIHSPDRRKVWVACDEHRDFLRDYLAAREFPVVVERLEVAAGVEGAT